MGLLKSAMRKVLPSRIAAAYEDYRQSRLAPRHQGMSTEQIFTEIYANNGWGGERSTFFSGRGSRDSSLVSPYVTRITTELHRLDAASMTAVDLGCGDYSVGRQLAPACGRYIGVDIVKPLIAYNQATFGSDKVSFQPANLVDDELPQGDICFIRQVLQHLSNDQIVAVLPKLNRFQWCFVTEHQPLPRQLIAPNRDKPPGDDIRVNRGSGVFLDAPPFNIPARRLTLLLEVPIDSGPNDADGGVIRTYLLERDAANESDLPRST